MNNYYYKTNLIFGPRFLFLCLFSAVQQPLIRYAFLLVSDQIHALNILNELTMKMVETNKNGKLRASNEIPISFIHVFSFSISISVDRFFSSFAFHSKILYS